jgi:hypothetical protein
MISVSDSGIGMVFILFINEPKVWSRIGKFKRPINQKYCPACFEKLCRLRVRFNDWQSNK